MKRFFVLASTAVAVVLVSAILVTAAFAAPGTPPAAGSGYGRGAGVAAGLGVGMRGGPSWAGFEDEVATFLGLTKEQVQAERQAGKSLAQIAESKGKTAAQLVTVILDAKKADLDKAVADKQITQEQADRIYSHMQEQVAQAVNRTTTGPAWGQGGMTGQPQGQHNGGRMGGRGMGRWANSGS